MDAWDATPASHRYATRPGEAITLRWLRGGALGLWALEAVAALRAESVHNGFSHNDAPLGVALLVLHAVAVAMALWLHLASRRAVVLTGAPLVLATALLVPHREAMVQQGMWLPGMWGMPWMIFCVMVLTRRHYLTFTSITFTVLAALDLAVTARTYSWQDTLLSTVEQWLPVAFGLTYLDALMRAAQSSNTTALRRAQAEEQQDQEALVADARREAARLLHDHVLHALHAVSRTSSQVTPQMVRDECRTAVAAIDQSTDPHETTARLENVLVEDPLMDRLEVHLRGSTDPLPTSVAIAMAAATHEALGNVERHARAQNVTVRLVQRDSQWLCSVIDDGQGFDQEKVNQRRLGLRRSVHERMEEVGGEATITSKPGAGTTVELRWPAVDDRARLLPSDPTNQVRKHLVVALWPTWVASLLCLPVLVGISHPLWASLLVFALMAGVGALEMYGLERRTLTLLDSLALLSTATVGWWLGLWALQETPGGLQVLLWCSTSLVGLVLLQRRLWVSGPALVLWTVLCVTLMERHVPGLAHQERYSLVVTPAARNLALLLGFQVCRNLALDEDQHRRQADVLRRATARLRMRSHLDQFWSDRVTGEAMPLMRDVAEGRLDPTDPCVADDARALEATLRDELILGPDHPGILSAMNRLRLQGWSVTSGLSTDNCATQFDLITSGLERLGPPAAREQMVTLSAVPGWANLVVLEPSQEQVRRWERAYADPGADLVVDPEFVRLTITALPGPVRPRRGIVVE